MILATSTVSTFVKYIFYVSDMLMEGQWEKKAVYTFYLVHELYVTFRNFRIRITDYVRYRKITSNMNERFPDATSEELDVEIGEQAEEEVPLRLLHGSFSSTGRILSTGTVPCCLPQCARPHFAINHEDLTLLFPNMYYANSSVEGAQDDV
ncbi:ERAD-associated E3 ubiquitin-protein ligase HRD1 isoform X4 [Zea mays]|nr:ERAD-associated E3 ubiquitin-protein ligase HRD1 isoform X4 [Zea mays]|eukprot:XP_020401507.1 ERAD-associated E3 ubiquitin-protein ligase HRD1 isoform X5 [Zea mays]